MHWRHKKSQVVIRKLLFGLNSHLFQENSRWKYRLSFFVYNRLNGIVGLVIFKQLKCDCRLFAFVRLEFLWRNSFCFYRLLINNSFLSRKHSLLSTSISTNPYYRSEYRNTRNFHDNNILKHRKNTSKNPCNIYKTLHHHPISLSGTFSLAPLSINYLPQTNRLSNSYTPKDS